MNVFARLFIIVVMFSAVICEQREGDIMLELSPAIETKKVKPFNLTIPQNGSISHQISVNSVNFRKNVTIGLTLYVWYNGGWVNKKSRLLQITEKRSIIIERDNLLMNLAKTRIRKITTIRNQLLLNSAQVYISHDPQGSLNTATLEEPALFIPNNRYTLVDLIHKNVSKVDVQVVFKLISKSDAFVENRRHLVELAEIRKKVEEIVPILGRPVQAQNFQPMKIWTWARNNIISLASQQKKITEKLDLMNKYGLRSLVAPDIKKTQLDQVCPQLDSYLKQHKMSYNENAPLAWKWIIQQQVMKNRIDSLSSSILSSPQELVQKDGLKDKIEAENQQQFVGLIVGGIWVLLDLIAYWCVKNNVGLSRSYGLFLNFWIIIQLVSWSIRVGLSLNGYAGLILLFVGLLLHGLISIPFENRFDSYPHKGTRFDKIMASFIKTIIILIVLFNITFHAYGSSNISFENFLREGFQILKKGKGQVFILVPWVFTELGLLVSEYYYVLAVIPQFFLNFRLKNVEKGTLVRVILLGVLSWVKSYSLDFQCEVSLFIGLKEGVFAILLLLQWLIFRNGKVATTHVDIQEEQEQAQPLQEQPQQKQAEQSVPKKGKKQIPEKTQSSKQKRKRA